MTAPLFGSPDLYLASFLVVSGYAVRKLAKDAAGHCVLYFDQTAAPKAVDFECGAPVDVRLYASPTACSRCASAAS